MVLPLLARPSRHRRPMALDADEERLLFAFIERDLPTGRRPHAASRGGQLRGQCRGELSPGRGQPARPGHDADHRLAPRGGTGQEAVRRRARPRVRALLPGRGHETHLRGPPRSTPGSRERWPSATSGTWRWTAPPGLAGFWGGIVGLSRLHVRCVWLSRRILWALTQVGHAVSCFMLRQMEYDADRYECRVAGSVAFRETMLRLRSSTWPTERRLCRAARELEGTAPAGQPAAAHRGDVRRRFPPRSARRPAGCAADAKTGLFDTHPCDADRIRAAEALDAPGVVRSTDPATTLFRDFAALSRKVTRLSYEKEQALPIQDANLVDTETYLRETRCPCAPLAPSRALLRRGEHGLPPDLDRPAGAAAGAGSRRGSRRAPIGPRSDEGGGRPRDVRPEAAGADPRAACQCRDGARAVGGGLRDRPGPVRVAGRHAGGGEGRDRAPREREQAERGATPGVQGPGRGPPAGGAAGARPPLPGSSVSPTRRSCWRRRRGSSRCWPRRRRRSRCFTSSVGGSRSGRCCSRPVDTRATRHW